MSLKLIVENTTALGECVETFEVVHMYNIRGKRTEDRTEACAIVVFDGTCHHSLQIEPSYIHPVS